MLQNLPETNNSGQYLVRQAKYLVIIGVIWALSAIGQVVADIVLPDPHIETLLSTISDPSPLDVSKSISDHKYNAWEIERVIHPDIDKITKSSNVSIMLISAK